MIAPDTASPGERELFKRFRDDPATGGWTVLHSFNLPRHISQVRGEADFVVLAPELGMLCLEVKAHRRVSRDADGRWRLGNDQPTTRSPFKQAEDNMHSLLGVLRERRRAEADAIIAWSAVAFTHVDFREPAVEWNDWEVIDSRDLRRTSIAELVTAILTHARGCLPHKAIRGVPSQRQCDVIAAVLRPRFEVAQAAARRRDEVAAELLAYTAEQYAALDGLSRNPRVVFEGPAGTGKTLLALEAARRASAEGERVLLVCFNRLLGAWIASQAKDLPGVTTSTLHQCMLRVSGAAPPQAASDEWFRDELPDLAVAALLDQEGGGAYDRILVDEAQDILRDAYLDFLDLQLAGGLSSGRWTFFGDFERQALFDAADVGLDEFLASRGPAPVYTLRANCRNTPRIARWVTMLSRLEPAYAAVRRPDGGRAPRIRYFTAAGDQAREVQAVLAELYAGGAEGRDVVLLSPARDSIAKRLPSPWKERLRPYAQDPARNLIRYATVQAFKGLEAPIVLVTDIAEVHGDRARSLFYTATTRPTEQLYVFADAVLRDEILDLMDRFNAEERHA
ncbi:nuclease-related domain-containing DEAD/DEAH box helicase [Solirubrobacter soli]|uniref:nuclease-related domain-containing DEAD/DEAH box helicase n=1 Tax=Solirubrobacter soli TaxID=363832 RepID=UPI000423113E|nr:NERD domain-containing protein [Solirubrobacter soli]